MQHHNKIIQFLLFSNMDVGILYVLQDFEPGSLVSISSGENPLSRSDQRRPPLPSIRALKNDRRSWGLGLGA
jgi:hypothetical protein